MGTRIHKELGYGLTDVITEDCEIKDPRINADSFLFSRTMMPTAEDYIAFVESESDSGNFEVQMEKGLIRQSSGTDINVYRLSTWQGEHGLPNVLLVRPFGTGNWVRHDDPIDFEEEALRGLVMESRVESTVGGIHPYNGTWMDVRDGERILGSQAEIIRTWQNVIHSPNKIGNRAELQNRLVKALGFESHEEAEKTIVPHVPEEVRRVAAWGELFTSPEVCLQLRPLIYTYWA